MNYILASASPRRRELLTQMGLSFDVCPSDCEEIITETTPHGAVMELAAQKALAVAGNRNQEDTIVIGSDTVVVKDQQILGKPCNEDDAYCMLDMLQNDTHAVYTGVCLVGRVNGTQKIHTFYEKTEVSFYPMTEAEIRSYIATGEPMDKAGAYGIQGRGGIYIQGIHGDYNNVVGLPIAKLYHELQMFLARD